MILKLFILVSCLLLNEQINGYRLFGKRQLFNPCNYVTCSNGGICAVSNNNLALCVCPAAYTGPTCLQLVTYNSSCPTGIANTICSNGGTCIASGNQLKLISCLCPTGYTGNLCQYVATTLASTVSTTTSNLGLPCSSFVPAIANPCSSGQQCYINNNLVFCVNSTTSGTSFSSSSVSTVSTATTSSVTTVPSTTAAPIPCNLYTPSFVSPCQNGAICLVSSNSISCLCQVGFTGVLCQTSLTSTVTASSQTTTAAATSSTTVQSTAIPIPCGLNSPPITSPCTNGIF
jgi:hypothetical protein